MKVEILPSADNNPTVKLITQSVFSSYCQVPNVEASVADRTFSKNQCGFYIELADNFK